MSHFSLIQQLHFMWFMNESLKAGESLNLKEFLDKVIDKEFCNALNREYGCNRSMKNIKFYFRNAFLKMRENKKDYRYFTKDQKRTIHKLVNHNTKFIEFLTT